jgi:fatty acid desaturase
VSLRTPGRLDSRVVDAEGLSKAELTPLLARSNGPGLLRISTQLLVLVLAALATLQLAAQGGSTWLAPVIVMGLSIATLFPPLHETGHRTAFATPWLNELVIWPCALAMLQAPSFFREFHWQHHRCTQDRKHDPEIASAPDLLDDWPSDPFRYFGLVSGVPLLLGKPMFTISCALLPLRARARLYPFIRESRHARIAWESRLVVALLAGTVTAGLLWVPHFATLLFAWPVSHLVLALYVMPEHTGLPNEGTQNHRTRSIVSNAVVRWLMWNMPLHATHHVHPSIPFCRLLEAHRRLEPALEHVASGYLAFHREALARAFGRRPATAASSPGTTPTPQ